MKPIIAVFLLIFFLIILYLSVSQYNTNVKNNTERFTALSGIENPLTTYDDYGTFNFILQMDDLPYYDPTYNEMQCKLKDYDPEYYLDQCGSINYLQPVDENFNKDSFINYQGFKVRRKLVPANYTKYTNLADADFNRNNLHLAIKKDRPQASAYPPQPHNVYFNKIPRNL